MMSLLLKLVFASAVAAADVPLEEDHLSLLQTRFRLQEGNGKITTNTSVVECPIGQEPPNPKCIKGHELKARFGNCAQQSTEPCQGPPPGYEVLPNVHQVGWYTGATTDSANMEFVDVGVGEFEKDGWLTSVKFWVQDARLNVQDGTSCPSGRCPLKGDKGFRFRLYYYGVLAGSWTLQAESEKIVMTVDGGIQEHTFNPPLPVKKRQLLGFAHDGTGNIPFDIQKHSKNMMSIHGPPKNDDVGCEFVDGKIGMCQQHWNSGGIGREYSYQIRWTDEDPAQAVEEPADEEPTGEEPAGDEAAEPEPDVAAVGDPHITAVSGEKYDMRQEMLKDEKPKKKR